MTKSSKFFGILCFLVMLISTFISFFPTASATETSLENGTISLLSNVIGLRTELYQINQGAVRDIRNLDCPQEETDMYLASATSSIRVTCTYTKDILQLVYFNDLQGKPALKQPASNTIDLAKGLLQRYQTYTNDSIYSGCTSLLNNVDENKNTTKLISGIKFEVTNFDQRVINYKWTYSDASGVSAERKNIVLSYEDGQLKFFMNNWPFYSVKGAPKVTADEATAIAVEASKSFSYKVVDENNSTQTVSGFDISPKSLGTPVLVYQNFNNQKSARGGDLFTLYPTWYVPLGFDKFYPGDVSGMVVYLWADTGQVCYMQEVVTDSTMFSSSDGSVLAKQSVGTEIVGGMIAVPALLVICLCILMVSVYRKRLFKSIDIQRVVYSRVCAVLLCAIIISSASSIVPSVGALTAPQSGSEIYACIHTPNGYHIWGVDEAEKEASKTICNNIEGFTGQAGYSTSNWCWDPGYGTTANRVGQNAQFDDQHFDRTTVFYVGHKSKDMYGLQDDNGNEINWYNTVGSNISSRSHFFVFLWVCSQADYSSVGMPTGWMNRTDMSSNGITSPDYQGQCYISFHGYSPMISSYPESQGHPTFYDEGYLGPCQEFIIFFYNYALTHDCSVYNALNQASIWYFDGDSYLASTLNQGYNCWWPGGGDQSAHLDEEGYYPKHWMETYPAQYPPSNTSLNCMRVFGDSTIKLYQPLVNFSGVCDDHDQESLNSIFTVDGEVQYCGSQRLISKTYSVNVGTLHNYQFSHFTFNGNNYSPGSIPLTSDGNLVAHYTWAPVYYNLAVSSSGPGNTNLTGTQPFLSYTEVNVQAIPNPGYLSYWTVDGGGDPDYNPTKTIIMDCAHSLQANFIPAPSYNFVTNTIDDTDPEFWPDAVAYPEKLCGVKSDGQFAILRNYFYPADWGYYGYIEANLLKSMPGRIYVNACATQNSGNLYVYVSSNGANWNPISPPASISQQTFGWVDCGSSSNAFKYIKFTVETEMSVYDIAIDSVKIMPLNVQSPTANYHFYENQGSIIHDSENSNDGNISGATWTIGKVDSGLFFDGVNNYCSVPNSASLQITSKISVCAWVKMSYDSNPTFVVVKDDSANYRYGLYASMSHYAAFYVRLSNVGVKYAIGSTPLNDNQWHCWVGTFDGRYVRLYVDGSLVNTADAGQTDTITSSSEPLVIGRWSSNGYYFKGMIDEVRIYSDVLAESNNALSIQQASNLYNSADLDLYTLTMQSSSGGTTNPTVGTYNYLINQQITITSTPSLGYNFNYWLANGQIVGTSTTLQLAMTQNYTVQPLYSTYPYIIINSGSNGYTTPLPGFYTGTGSLWITAYGNSGYHFDHWNNFGNYYSNQATINVNYDNWYSLTPVFAQDPPGLTILACTNGHTSPQGPIYYSGTGPWTIYAYPDSGYRVAYWELDGQPVSYLSPSYHYYMPTGTHTLKAVFELIPPPVTLGLRARNLWNDDPMNMVTVYIDGVPSAWCNYVSVTPGTYHTIYVEPTDGVVFGWYVLYLWGFCEDIDGGLSEEIENGGTILVTQEIEILAIYGPYF